VGQALRPVSRQIEPVFDDRPTAARDVPEQLDLGIVSGSGEGTLGDLAVASPCPVELDDRPGPADGRADVIGDVEAHQLLRSVDVDTTHSGADCLEKPQVEVVGVALRVGDRGERTVDEGIEGGHRPDRRADGAGARGVLDSRRRLAFGVV